VFLSSPSDWVGDLDAAVFAALKALADQEKAVSSPEGRREGETLSQLEARLFRLEKALLHRRVKCINLKETIAGVMCSRLLLYSVGDLPDQGKLLCTHPISFYQGRLAQGDCRTGPTGSAR